MFPLTRFDSFAPAAPCTTLQARRRLDGVQFLSSISLDPGPHDSEGSERVSTLNLTFKGSVPDCSGIFGAHCYIMPKRQLGLL
jgi:hypothetical protein